MLPLYIRGIADLETNSIILSTRWSNMWDTFLHELAHLIIRDRSHSQRWKECYANLGGKIMGLNHHESIDNQFTNIGYMPNIGNISGIQNIY